jgi:hypothetical protein
MIDTGSTATGAHADRNAMPAVRWDDAMVERQGGTLARSTSGDDNHSDNNLRLPHKAYRVKVQRRGANDGSNQSDPPQL